MDRYAGRFADGHEAGGNAVGIAVLQRDHLSVVIGRDPAHVVMHRRQDGNGRPGDVHSGENVGRLCDPGQAFVDHIRSQVFQVQVEVIPFRANSAPLPDFDGHGAADHVTGSQVLGIGGVTLHEPFTLRIGQVTALAAHPFGNQHTGAVNAGRMELNEFHVLQRQAGAQYHGIAVTGAGMGGGTGEISASIPPRSQDHGVGAKAVQFPLFQVPGQDSPAHTCVVHDQVDGKIFNEKFGIMLQGLLVQGMQDGVTGAVGSGAGTLRRAFTEVSRHSTERTLINLAVYGTREGYAVMFQFDHCSSGLLAHIFNGILVAQPVRPLDGIVHVPAPVILAHIAQGRAHAPLGRNGVTAGGKDLGDASRFQLFLGHAEGGAQPGAAGAYHNNIVFMLNQLVGCAHCHRPRWIDVTASMEASAHSIARNFTRITASVFCRSLAT